MEFFLVVAHLSVSKLNRSSFFGRAETWTIKYRPTDSDVNDHYLKDFLAVSITAVFPYGRSRSRIPFRKRVRLSLSFLRDPC
jgi:hypothetical protein